MADKSSFYARVYALVRQIPSGKVTSYGAIARALGAAKSARMVGYAMGNSPEDVPAHRVVNRVGILTGKHHFPGTHLMQQLLENEGLTVINDQVQDFEQHFWAPTPEDYPLE